MGARGGGGDGAARAVLRRGRAQLLPHRPVAAHAQAGGGVWPDRGLRRPPRRPRIRRCVCAFESALKAPSTGENSSTSDDLLTIICIFILKKYNRPPPSKKKKKTTPPPKKKKKKKKKK